MKKKGKKPEKHNSKKVGGLKNSLHTAKPKFSLNQNKLIYLKW